MNSITLITHDLDPNQTLIGTCEGEGEALLEAVKIAIKEHFNIEEEDSISFPDFPDKEVMEKEIDLASSWGEGRIEIEWDDETYQVMLYKTIVYK